MVLGIDERISFIKTQLSKLLTEERGALLLPEPTPIPEGATGKVLERIEIDPPEVGVKEKIRQGWHSFNVKMVDDLYAIKKFTEEATKGGVELAIEENPYMLSRLLKGVTSKSTTFLTQGTFGKKFWKVEEGKAVPNFTGESLETILKEVKKPEQWRDFSAYLVARRAIELSQRDIETGIAMDDAQEGGIDDVGIGVLFGLYDYKFEVMALLMHSKHLEEKYGVGPHTISVPRIRPALNAPLANEIPSPVSDKDFKKLVAIIRLAVPYTGIILSTREKADFRDEVIELGISQISAGSKTNPGAYNEKKEDNTETEQFQLEDERTQLEVIKDIIKKGHLPSFCTACYRTGRTGEDFMHLAKPGDIKNFCLPNSILTFKEYVIDYGDKELQDIADNLIKKELQEIPNETIRKKTKEKIAELNSGSRDLYF